MVADDPDANSGPKSDANMLASRSVVTDGLVVVPVARAVVPDGRVVVPLSGCVVTGDLRE